MLERSQLIFSGSGSINENLPEKLDWLETSSSEEAMIFSVSNHLRRIRQKIATLESGTQ